MGASLTEVKNWSDEKAKEVTKRLLSVARNGIKQAYPNLANEQQVADMNTLLDAAEAEITESFNHHNELENLPEMTKEQADTPDSDPTSEQVAGYDPGHQLPNVVDEQAGEVFNEA